MSCSVQVDKVMLYRLLRHASQIGLVKEQKEGYSVTAAGVVLAVRSVCNDKTSCTRACSTSLYEQLTLFWTCFVCLNCRRTTLQTCGPLSRSCECHMSTCSISTLTAPSSQAQSGS